MGGEKIFYQNIRKVCMIFLLQIMWPACCLLAFITEENVVDLKKC